MSTFLDFLQACASMATALIPTKTPPKNQLRAIKIVAHRGHHIYPCVENSMEAFKTILDAGVWGVEFDVRWTKDLIPVVCHDPDGERLFYRPDIILSDLTFKQLRKEIPDIPSLKEVVHLIGKKVHLMIEIKKTDELEFVLNGPPPLHTRLDHMEKTILDILCDLTPSEDYHIMSLDPDILDLFSHIPAKAKISISETNVEDIFDRTISKGYGGMTGHYLLLTNQKRSKLSHHNIKYGTGFVDSLNNLYRETNRHNHWSFSNNAVELQEELNQVLQHRDK